MTKKKLCHCGALQLAKGLCSKHYNEQARKDKPGWNKKYSDKWRKNNPDKIKASNAVRRKRYKKFYSSKLTRDIVLDLLKKQDLCASCEVRFDDEVIATLDHKTPISRGGDHEKDNLHLLCFSCNSSKKDKTWEEFCEYKANKSGGLSSIARRAGEGEVAQFPKPGTES